MRLGTIYGLYDPTTDELRYVGKTVRNLAIRMSQHRSAARQGKRPTHVNTWIRSLPSAPVARVLEQWDVRRLDEREKYWIARFRAEGARLCNHTDGGPGTIGRPCSEETREKMRVALTGKPGRVWTEAQREHARRVHTGRRHSKASKAKMRAARLGTKASAETRAKMSAARSGERHPLFGKRHSPESIAKMRESHRRRHATDHQLVLSL